MCLCGMPIGEQLLSFSLRCCPFETHESTNAPQLSSSPHPFWEWLISFCALAVWSLAKCIQWGAEFKIAGI